MTIRGGNTAAVLDKRVLITNSLSFNVVADSDFPEGAAAVISGSHLTPMGAKWSSYGNPTTTRTVYGAVRAKLVSETLTDVQWGSFLVMDRAGIGDAATVPYATLRFYGNGTVLIAAFLTNDTAVRLSGTTTWTTTDGVTDWELEVAEIAAGEFVLKAYKNGTVVITFAYPVTTGMAWANYSRVLAGGPQSIGKNNFEIRASLIAGSDTDGSAPFNTRPFDMGFNGIEPIILLPNGDVTQEWLTDAGATGTYTQWDDALGSWLATTYNETTTAAGIMRQRSTLANLPSTPDYIGCVTALLTSQLVAAPSIGLNDGTEELRTPFTLAANPPNCAMDSWLIAPSGVPWTPTLVNGLDALTHRGSSSTNNRVSALWAIIWTANDEIVASGRRRFGLAV